MSALDGGRLRALRELKGIRSQQALADLVDESQSHICDLENGKLRNHDVFLKVANALDCETDFLHARGRYKTVDLRTDSGNLRAAASEMAFVFFVADCANEEWIARCRKVLGHKAAPITSEAWLHLAEQIERAVGSSPSGSLKRFVRQ